MKKLVLFTFMFITSSVYAYTVCGPYIPDNAEYGYTIKMVHGVPAKWAVGTNCVGQITDGELTDLCETIYAAGHAYLGAWGSGDYVPFDHTQAGVYNTCFCRRTHTMSNGELRQNIGQWVLLTQGTSEANCSKACAKYVATDAANLRTPIMLLPSFLEY